MIASKSNTNAGIGGCNFQNEHNYKPVVEIKIMVIIIVKLHYSYNWMSVTQVSW